MSRTVTNMMMVLCVAMVFGLTGCGGGGGNAPNNNVTVAKAGAAQNVVAGNPVTLDGSQSTGAAGSLITYQWSIVSKPAGSAAILNNPTTVNPTISADVAGPYTLKLIVTDAKAVTSEDTVIITVTASSANASPVANAGVAQSVITGAVITLDGSASSDANGDALTYNWTFTSKPTGSNAVLSSATVAKPTFIADVTGAYVLNLVVNDGKVNSAAVTATVTASVSNVAPVANAGAAQNAITGAIITLDGSGSSDANGDTLTYSWAFTSKPSGSTSTLSSATVARPTFTPDVAGAYVLNLAVNDGKIDSAVATVTVTVTAIDQKHLNVAYVAASGLTVTLTAFTKVDNGEYYTYSCYYTERNNTSAPIVGDQAVLNLSDGTSLSQSGSSPIVYPGDTQSRGNIFMVLYSQTPTSLVIDNLMIASPVAQRLQYLIPIPN